MKLKIIICLISLISLMSCASHLKEILPVEQETKQGEAIVKIEPSRTGDREDVPVGVKPSEVVAEVKTKTGAKVWVVKKKRLILPDKIEVYENKEAVKEGVVVEKPKKSYKWLYWTIGSFALLLFCSFALERFFGFNPIALAGSWIYGFLKRKKE